MLNLSSADRTDACGVSDAVSTERLAGASRIPETEIARLGRGLITKPRTAIENMMLI